MPVKVQGDNGKNGVGVFGSTCRGFFRVFDLHHYVRGSTPRLATIRLRPLSITKTIRGACPLAYCRQEKMDGIEEKVKSIAAVVDTLPNDELKARCVLFMYAEEETCTVSVRGSDEMLTKLTLYSMMSDSSFAEAMIKAVSGYQKINRMVSRCVSKKEEHVC